MRPIYWELNKRGGGKRDDIITLGRRFCSGCGRWRHLCDFAEHKGGPRPRCRGCQRAYQRCWRSQMTPEQREREREYNRIWQDAKRREAGTERRRFHRRHSVIDRIEFVGLPPEPLLAEIDRSGVNTEELARMSGVPARSVFRFRSGESQHVRLDVADKIAVALKVPLALIYGDTPTISFHATATRTQETTR